MTSCKIKYLESQLAEAHADCAQLQQYINCLKLPPCQLPACVKAREEIERVKKEWVPGDYIRELEAKLSKLERVREMAEDHRHDQSLIQPTKDCDLCAALRDEKELK